MKGRIRFLRIVALSLCFILAASLAEFQEQEPFGLHVASDGERTLFSESDVAPDHIQLTESDSITIPDPLDEWPCIATFAMLPGPYLSHTLPPGAGSRPLNGVGPGSSTDLRI